MPTLHERLMSERRLTSIGIDIGTTTTQVLLSELTVGTAGQAGADKLVVTGREIFHRGEIHRTRLLDAERTVLDRVAEPEPEHQSTA